MSDKQFIVYSATNVANGHRYIGYTSVGLDGRRAKHLKDAFGAAKRGYRLHAALRKYGREAFVWVILAVFETSAEAFAEEIRLIAELKPEYNVTAGGEGASGRPSKNRRPVTCLTDGRMFVSCIAAGRFYGLGQTAVYSICAGTYRSAGNKLHFIFGDSPYSPEERTKLIWEIERTHAERRKRVKINKAYGDISGGFDSLGRRAGQATLGRPVVCIDDGKRYASASAAGRAYNISRSSIIELCLGKNGRQTVGGLRFKYETVEA